MERALLVSVKIKGEASKWGFEDIIEEMGELAKTAGALVVDSVTCLCQKVTPNLYIGKGKAEEIAILCQEEDINTVIFSLDLSGTQHRNLEEAIGKKIIDRTQLILHIFARHAKTPQGKMQVELAQLKYLMPRLIGQGVILSRTGGGIGTSGPGEQQLEVDRRRIREKIDRLQAELKQTFVHRKLMRKNRKERAVPSVALVGYTNAGKSTLLNALTHAGQIVSNGLFTTLDPLAKNLKLPSGENVVISDTVGFLNNLPHHLVEAFKATLEEVVEADLLIHVLDVSHKRVYEHSQAVFAVLSELEADKNKVITVLNKIDLLEDPAWLAKLQEDFSPALPISAKLGLNLDNLLENIQKLLVGNMVSVHIRVSAQRMDLVGSFYKEGKVREVKYLAKGIEIKLDLPKRIYDKLLHDKDIVVLESSS